jgi:hypothetical protein
MNEEPVVVRFEDIGRWMAEHPRHVIVSLWLHSNDLSAFRNAVAPAAPNHAHALESNGIRLYWGRDVLRGTVRIVANEVPKLEDVVAAMNAIRARMGVGDD